MVSTHPPSGFRDFINQDAHLRSALIHRISEVYQSFGFSPIETPAFENLDVLQGSGGGEENEKLIFKVLKRGDKLKEAMAGGEDAIADYGMRFDLTVPLSRVVAEYRGQIHFPWKVFHIGPVWRAERAQKGRFREFIQCDVDIVGAKTNAAEVEVIQAVVHAVHSVGGSGFELRINDRRLLQALGSKLNLLPKEFSEFAILLDKKDKMEPADLLVEVKQLLGSKMSDLVERVLSENLSMKDASGLDAQVTSELGSMIDLLTAAQLPLEAITFDPSLVRGIGYYTGPVFELRHRSAGYSFGGGGRYDQLIGRFSKEAVPACGFSIGFERLFLLLKESNASLNAHRDSRIFVPVFSPTLRAPVLGLAKKLREAGLSIDVYPDDANLKKQFKFASDAGFRWVLIAGDDEIKNHSYKVKDLESGEETNVHESNLVSELSKRMDRLSTRS